MQSAPSGLTWAGSAAATLREYGPNDVEKVPRQPLLLQKEIIVSAPRCRARPGFRSDFFPGWTGDRAFVFLEFCFRDWDHRGERAGGPVADRNASPLQWDRNGWHAATH